jgi:triphosphatase
MAQIAANECCRYHRGCNSGRRRTAVKSQIEVELKFLVARSVRAGIVAEMARGSADPGRVSLSAIYLDTPDRRLARAGLTWRLRREGRRWVQTLKAGRSSAFERFEHEVTRPGASPDPAVHAGTEAGNRLVAVLRKARAEGIEPGVRFRTLVRRTTRRIRTRGAVVDVSFDQGRLVAGDESLPVREIEFELVSGSLLAMLRLVERWRMRFELVYDPRSKAERGDRLADGTPHPPPRKAGRPSYERDATPTAAFAAVLDECLAHISHNSIGLIEGDPAQRVEHVHQLRVGIRRLRTALRSYRGWIPAPPDELVAGLRALFATLGRSRDSDVLGSGVLAAELAKAGAPLLKQPADSDAPDPVQAVRAAPTQRLLLAWLAWRAALQTLPLPVTESLPGAPARAADPSEPARPSDEPRRLRRNVARRLRRWHSRLVADWESFDELDESGLHALRKRIKRQRYAVEFFAPLLRQRRLERYIEALSAIQDRMGSLADLFVARSRYQALAAPDPAAWFALGWLAARIAAQRALAKPELGRLAEIEPPAP